MVKSKSRIILVLVVLAAVIFGGSAWSWWHYSYNKPTKVFDRMLSAMLSTPSVTKTVTQQEDQQKLTQTMQLTTSPEAQVHSSNLLDQGAAVVTTESIGSIDQDFIRYKNIETSQKNSQGKAFDFSSVLGVWGKSGDNKAMGEEPQLFNQTLLGVVPMARLNPNARKQLLDQMHKDNVFAVDASTIKRSTKKGRPTYTYQVTVQPVAYINMLRTFAHLLGSNQLDQVDASQYEGTAALKFTFDVDVWSTQLASITYQDTNRTETFSAYGAQTLVKEPANAISVDELQSRLQKIQ